jgi:hypothetical protein
MRGLAKLLLLLLLLVGTTTRVLAAETSKIGVHILHTSELTQAKQLVQVSPDDSWHYVTIPFTVADLEREAEWQIFFTQAKEQKLIPLVRLTTKVENGAWMVPTKKEITQMITFLSRLEWPTAQRHIIVFNEVNHAKEWGGTINPEEYAEILNFTKNWANTEQKNYVVLPAAMDLAAPNGAVTREAFSYLTAMYAYDNEVFMGLGGWNSHSYPNPGFSAAPQRSGKNSLRGYEHELAFLEGKTDRELPVYITETGWEDSRATSRWLAAYYTYAMQHIWSDERVQAVTPFVLKGEPGPFAGFSFLKGDNTPTRQYYAFQTALKQAAGQTTASRQ